MKKIMLVAAGFILLMVLAPSAVLAGPPSPPDYGNWNPINIDLGPGDWEAWGVEKVKPPFSAPGGSVHIVTDPLVGADAEDGWVTFWCQSKIGFKYNIGATGLDPLSRYSVKANGVQAHMVPPGTPGAIHIPPPEDIWIIVDSLIDLDLGTLHTDANGLGGVNGVEKLTSGYLYDVGIVVYDSNNIPVLWSPASDTNGFIVY